jgi:membrane-associated phospholipid phosphatase
MCSHQSWLRPIVLLTLAALLAGCAAAAAPAPAPTAIPEARPRDQKRWLVTDADAVIEALPPLPAMLPEAPAVSPDPSLLEHWREPASRWVEVELRAISAESLDLPHASRALMLLGVAMNDGAAVAAQARANGVDVADHAVIAEAARRVIAYLHPMLELTTSGDVETATWAGVWRGEASVAGVVNGRHLGAAVADRVLAWAAADGSAEAAPAIVLPTVPGAWHPTALGDEAPLEPRWGNVRTVTMTNGPGAALLRAPLGPRLDADIMEEQLAELRAAQAALTEARRELARHWEGGAGTVTVAGSWAQIAAGQVAEGGLGTAQAAAVYGALGVALHDATVAAWGSKYHYWAARPAQILGAAEPSWQPLLTTPPYPSYPSAHAAVSGAAAGVLAAFFPDAAMEMSGQAHDAASSRVDGGVAWPLDVTAGLEQGVRVARVVLEQRTGQ